MQLDSEDESDDEFSRPPTPQHSGSDIAPKRVKAEPKVEPKQEPVDTGDSDSQSSDVGFFKSMFSINGLFMFLI